MSKHTLVTFTVIYNPELVAAFCKARGVNIVECAPRPVAADNPWHAHDITLAHMRQVLNMPGLNLFPVKIKKNGIAKEAFSR